MKKIRKFKLTIWNGALILLGVGTLAVSALLLTKYSTTERQLVEMSFTSSQLTELDMTPLPEPEQSEETTTANKVCANEMTYVQNVLIVNKKHCLSSTYNPGENPEAVANLRNLIASGQENGIDLIYAWSGFRSYATQVQLYNSYASKDGVALADTYSARPGFSEHQTGLTFDLKDHTGDLYCLNDGVTYGCNRSTYNKSTDWVALHAHEYGFIVRYFDATQSVTGYTGEPWHLRYLGVDLATKVYNSGVTLEEYLGVEGGDYAN